MASSLSNSRINLQYQQQQQQSSRPSPYPLHINQSRSFRGLTVPHTAPSTTGTFPAASAPMNRTFSSPPSGGFSGAGLPQGYASSLSEARNMAAYAMGGFQFSTPNVPQAAAPQDPWLQVQQQPFSVEDFQRQQAQAAAAIAAYQHQLSSYPPYPGPR